MASFATNSDANQFKSDIVDFILCRHPKSPRRTPNVDQVNRFTTLTHLASRFSLSDIENVHPANIDHQGFCNNNDKFPQWPRASWKPYRTVLPLSTPKKMETRQHTKNHKYTIQLAHFSI